MARGVARQQVLVRAGLAEHLLLGRCLLQPEGLAAHLQLAVLAVKERLPQACAARLLLGVAMAVGPLALAVLAGAVLVLLTEPAALAAVLAAAAMLAAADSEALAAIRKAQAAEAVAAAVFFLPLQTRSI